jgi:cytochrome P450
MTSAPPANASALRPYDHEDLSSLAFWSSDADTREATFARLRARDTITWHPPAEGGLMPHDDDPGFWAVVSHGDVVSVSRRPQLFCSSQGVMFEDIPQDILDATQSFLGMDAPRHTVLRRLISAAFTPKQVARIDAQIAEQARKVVDDLIQHGDGDFVALVARRLPMWTISEMMGIDPGDHQSVAAAANSMVGWNDPTLQDGRDPLTMLIESMLTLHTAAITLATTRRSDPADDLMTALVQAEVDGERLTDAEIAAFFVLLAVAGNDTTRNTISHGMKALCDFPEQQALWRNDIAGRTAGAIEELVRWASPVMTFRRTATQDIELGGQVVAAGEKVVMFYAAANRDDTVFDQPAVLDTARATNPHVGFGGGGPHFCMGASLARTQLSAIFEQLLTRVPHLELGQPEFLVGNFIHGITSMPCTLNL